uniref:Receptor activity-modifying protein 1 n=1 Tax=Amphiprion ocellaris TaxID=80972 RepID=A0AAQ5YG18_AMPOC
PHTISEIRGGIVLEKKNTNKQQLWVQYWTKNAACAVDLQGVSGVRLGVQHGSGERHTPKSGAFVVDGRIYEGLTNCTYQVAMRMDCFWPNQIVDQFFMQIHQTYFQDCALTGRLLHDPPISVLAPFIAVPVLVTLLMTALVVWRSKRTEGVL